MISTYSTIQLFDLFTFTPFLRQFLRLFGYYSVRLRCLLELLYKIFTKVTKKGKYTLAPIAQSGVLLQLLFIRHLLNPLSDENRARARPPSDSDDGAPAPGEKSRKKGQRSISPLSDCLSLAVWPPPMLAKQEWQAEWANLVQFAAIQSSAQQRWERCMCIKTYKLRIAFPSF